MLPKVHEPSFFRITQMTDILIGQFKGEILWHFLCCCHFFTWVSRVLGPESEISTLVDTKHHVACWKE